MLDNKNFARNLFNTKEQADVVVVIGQGEAQQKFYAHKLVLASVSEVFQNLFYNGGNADVACDAEGFQILELPASPEKVSVFALKAIYGVVKNWHSDKKIDLKCTEENIGKVLEFAEKYKSDELRKFCEVYQRKAVLDRNEDDPPVDVFEEDQSFSILPLYSASYGHQLIFRPKQDIFITYVNFGTTVECKRFICFRGLKFNDSYEKEHEKFDSDEDWLDEFPINAVFEKDEVYVWNFYPKDCIGNEDYPVFLTQKITCNKCKRMYGDHAEKCPTAKIKVMQIESPDGESQLDVLFAAGFNGEIRISSTRLE